MKQTHTARKCVICRYYVDSAVDQWQSAIGSSRVKNKVISKVFSGEQYFYMSDAHLSCCSQGFHCNTPQLNTRGAVLQCCREYTGTSGILFFFWSTWLLFSNFLSFLKNSAGVVCWHAAMMKTGATKVGLPKPGLQERVRQGSLTSSSSTATSAAMKTSRSSSMLASDQRLSRVSHKSLWQTSEEAGWIVPEHDFNTVSTDSRFCF